MMANEKFLKWADEELIPLLKFAYGESLHGSWERRIGDASRSIANLAVKEDFPSTVERVRLLLVNPEIMTPADVRNFGWVRREIDMCIGVFVRHALKHGTYKLASLGTEPDPDHPRRKLSENEHETYIWGGKFAARDPEMVRKKAELVKERKAQQAQLRTGRGVFHRGRGNFLNFGGSDTGGRGGRHRSNDDFGVSKLSIKEGGMVVGGPVQKPADSRGVFRFGFDGAASDVERPGSASTQSEVDVLSDVRGSLLSPEAAEFIPSAWGFR